MKDMIVREVKTHKMYRIPYDETAPCSVCGNPVVTASMNGPTVCPSCDIGVWRNGSKFDIAKTPYLLKDYAHLRPHVPIFSEVHAIAFLMACRGIHAYEYELACYLNLEGKKEPWFANNLIFKVFCNRVSRRYEIKRLSLK